MPNHPSLILNPDIQKKHAKDVTGGKESFGPGGPYAAFAGHDATYNLAVMTLKKQSVDKFAARLDGPRAPSLDW